MGLFQKKTVPADSKPLYSIGGQKTLLIIGLGNIGKEYEDTRHNIGFEVADAFAANHDFGWVNKKDLHCHLASGIIGSTRVIIVKPTTFMNESGQAAQAVQHFYRVYNPETFVVHDELDIDLGVIKTKIGGGSAGHNGIKSLVQNLGDDFGRIRIGIGPKKPTQIDSADFVLAKFTKEEQANLKQIINESCSILDELTASHTLQTETRKIVN
ncbi:MAG: aminoacyl-tRNA hydrolase [bacterium]|nr:aminoacyl-tRNA hydrolase [bacterium]